MTLPNTLPPCEKQGCVLLIHAIDENIKCFLANSTPNNTRLLGMPGLGN